MLFKELGEVGINTLNPVPVEEQEGPGMLSFKCGPYIEMLVFLKRKKVLLNCRRGLCRDKFW